jgi:hypothetical protein
MRKLLDTLCLCCVVSFSFAAFACGESAPPASESHIPSTPADSADASKSGPQVAVSVVHVMCANIPSGTGFIHKSGWVITAAHVVEPCGKSTMVRTAVGQKIPVKDVRRNDLLDLAILALEPRPEVPRTLTLSTNSLFTIGLRVSTWGFPYGYSGDVPLLSVGYLAGVQQFQTNTMWVVNGAFNSGNSGGPVISLQDGSVIGVVNSKLGPIPDYLKEPLDALAKDSSGILYKSKRPDGTVKEMTEAQITAEVLDHLRRQVQLVVGYAVQVKDLRQFLKDNGIEP